MMFRRSASPTDNVDPAMMQRPKRWQIGFIRQFMTIIGPISSIYDFLTFGVLLWVFHASTNESLFHTGWFVESLATQTLVVFVIRTADNPLKSRPSRPLLISVLAIVVVATVLPYTPLGSLLRFTPLPLIVVGRDCVSCGDLSFSRAGRQVLVLSPPRAAVTAELRREHESAGRRLAAFTKLIRTATRRLRSGPWPVLPRT